MASVFHEDAESVMDRIHHSSWSTTLEKHEHADDRALVLVQAIDAVNYMVAAHYINVVTHVNHVHSSEFLFRAFTDEFDDDLEWKYIDRVGVAYT